MRSARVMPNAQSSTGMSAGVPVVGPGEDVGPGQAHQLGLAQVAREQSGLLRLAMPERVQAELAQDQRAVADQVLQPEHVVAERRMVVQIDVEGHEIEEGEIEILRGGVAGVGDQAVGVGLLDHVPQLREESLDAPRAVPADDIGRDLVADVIGQDAGMISTGFGRAADAPARIGLGPATLEEADVRGPGDVHEDGHPALIDQIE